MPVTRSWSPWIDAWTFSFESLISRWQLAAAVGIDAVAQHEVLLRRVQVDLRLARLEADDVDAALRELQLQDVEHLLELEIDLGVQRDQVIRQLEIRARVPEVEALGHLAIRLVHGVRELVRVDLRDDVEEGTLRRALSAARRPAR